MLAFRGVFGAMFGGLGQVHGGTDKRHVTEALGEIAKLLTGGRIDLLSE